MSIKEYHLYRAKFIKPAQLSLLSPDMSTADIFHGAILGKPSIVSKGGAEWHIGNIVSSSSLTGSFAVGRSTKKVIEKYDRATGDFIDQLGDAAPYTKVIFDCEIGLLGIAKKTSLAPDAHAVATKIQNLFKRSIVVQECGIDVVVSFIRDPQDFLVKLNSAHSIKRFKATFTGPNPIDADELFQKPLSVYCQKMHAEHGCLDVYGSSIDPVVATLITKSTAATGNTASAKIQLEKDSKITSIALKGIPAVVQINDELGLEEQVSQMKEEYRRIRL
jgi:hypothetical protein